MRISPGSPAVGTPREGRCQRRLASFEASEPQCFRLERSRKLGTTAATQEAAADRRESEPRSASEPKPSREQGAPGGKRNQQPGGRRAPKRRHGPIESG